MNHTLTESTGAGKGSLQSYLIGFVLSLFLTALPFYAVMKGGWAAGPTLAVIVAAGVLQILIHLHYFLHLDYSSGGGWNVPAFIFTVLILILFVGGSIWVMHSLDMRMM